MRIKRETIIKITRIKLYLKMIISSLLNKKRIILFGTPLHGNLGDQAIIHAEREFFREHFKKYKLIEVPMIKGFVNSFVDIISKYIKQDDILVGHGGGNMGIEYLHEEEIRRYVAKNFLNNKIIIFPQTAYYGESEEGKEELEKSANIYKQNKNLAMIAREGKSFEIMKNNFSNEVILTPDIVLYLNLEKPKMKRDGVLVCLRHDVESAVSDEKRDEIIAHCKEIDENVKVTDTVAGSDLLFKFKGKKVLFEKFNEFKSARLVVTDRLHGMVIAAITGTPCVAFSNYNHKVRETYDWLKHLEYIQFCQDIESLDGAIKKVLSVKNAEYHSIYEKYAEDIERLIKR